MHISFFLCTFIVEITITTKVVEAMKANLTNLKKVLKLCANAHNAKFEDWSCEAQLGINSETPGTICDVSLILDAFYGRHDFIEVGYGYTSVWLEEMMYRNKNQVDMEKCLMALPYGTVIS